MEQEKKIEKTDLIKDAKKGLEAMSRDVSMNKIPFNQFQLYYTALKGYISLGTEDYLPYAMSLSNAEVLIIDYNSEESFKKISKDLGDIIANRLRKGLQTERINLAEDYAKIKNLISRTNISLDSFYSSCDKLRLAMMAKIDGINYLKWAKTLQGASVIPAKTYDEIVKYQGYQKLLSDVVSQLEQNTKGVSKR